MQITYAFIVDLVEQEPLILDILDLLMPQDQVLVYDLYCILFMSVLLPCQYHLSKTAVSKPSHKLKV